MSDKVLNWGHKRFEPNDKHIAGWGARLIYDEVKAGYGGIVWDRQDAFGEPRLIETEVWPIVQKYMTMLREWMTYHYGGSGSADVIELTDGKVTIKGSPQQSYGYFYVTALLEE